jgi:uncharacterized protein (TIGR01777 family)
MKVAVSGSTGLIGSALVAELETGGHSVHRIVRSKPDRGDIPWDPAAGKIDAAALAGIDAVVHLAGESIAGGRWNEARKKAILESRVQGTGLIARTLAGSGDLPKTLVTASAIGYFGDRGDETLTEESPPGDDFLARVCREWEAAAEPAAQSGVRVCRTRFGIILSRGGGALSKMLLPFRLGVGGIIGSGRQYMSWITLDDVVGALLHVLEKPEIAGPVNVAAPQPVTNAAFTKALGRALSRPTLLPLPAFAARLLLGEMADGLLLSSARVRPAKLLATGYRFRHTDLEEGLCFELGR